MVVTIIRLYKTEVYMKNTQELRTLTLEEIEMVNGAGLVGNVVSGLNGVVNQLETLPKDLLAEVFSLTDGIVKNLVNAVL